MSMRKENFANITPWWVVYEEIAQKLQQLFENNSSSEKLLYKLCVNKESFLQENSWISKFRKAKVEALDPIHIFASISGNRLRALKRLQRINILLEILESDEYYENIDFSGCPTPAVISILSVRSYENQLEIWELFNRVYTGGQLYSYDFKNYTDWYGVRYTLLTIFLFWIRSDIFLPVDRNTQNFLKKYRLKVPRGHADYENLLAIIGENNSETDEGYGENGLYREIALHAYNDLNNVKSPSKKTFSYLSFIEKLELGTYTASDEAPMIESTRNVEIEEDAEKVVVDRVYKPRKKGTPIAGLGFKLVAIVPQEGSKHLKILKEEPLYFEKTFALTETEEVIYYPKKQLSLYDLKLGRQTLKVNVTAIVGKNGSGKSSLVELFFRMINNITHQFQEDMHTEEIIFEEGVNAKLYYITNEYLYCIHVYEDENTIQEYTYNETEHTFTKFGDVRTLEFSDLDSFFYTVAINYSHYALNSLDMPWIEKLFLKNDAYQAPIVLNPMRQEGNIDINTEDKLVKSRLLVNLFKEVEEEDLGMRQLTEKQKVKKITFKLNNNKCRVWVKEQRAYVDMNDTQLYSDRVVILEAIYRNFGFSREFPANEDEVAIFTKTEKYILKKLVSIAERYAPYHQYLVVVEDDIINCLHIETIDDYAAKLKDDDSHITYKLRQAIHYIKYKGFIPWETEFSLSLDAINEQIEAFFREGSKDIENVPLIELLPPSIFDVNIYLEDKDGKESDFKFLSSGEKQQIYAASSILYHFQNIDSVDSEELISYNSINFLLDEIELYYHPEMQRSYLAYLLKMLSRMEVSTLKSINICMVTHSPYILSDIPDNYLLRLEDGKASEKKEDKTFGANIHDLLANNFFMSSTTGEFAQIQIREIVNFYYRVKRYVEAQNDTNSSQNQNIAKIDSEKELKLIYEDKEERFRYVIKNMGEDVVKSILENHIKFIESKLGVENKQLKIERLNEEIRKRQEELLKLQGDD
jgi:predicted ATPase